ncbi:hypothetical protein [Roseivirga sp. UBA838]|uniref:hypothetical protein n=1 Tax=Roseivirga sp. UBA838 TaxID=1947393 RepID=UPI00257EF677|nr:hypothetical protein [Roseivirga sp. UBA838]|tara:strand:+ start:13192 stop:13527 length:336 start_codon:yes stop_codon:yes gene_type:complete
MIYLLTFYFSLLALGLIWAVREDIKKIRLKLDDEFSYITGISQQRYARKVFLERWSNELAQLKKALSTPFTQRSSGKAGAVEGVINFEVLTSNCRCIIQPKAVKETAANGQ